MRKISLSEIIQLCDDEVVCEYCSTILKFKSFKRHLKTKTHIKNRNFVLENHEKSVHLFKEDLKTILNEK